MLDVSVGIMIANLFNEKKTKNILYFELIYFFNPISILNCISFRLDIFYIFVVLMFVKNYESFLGLFFLVLSIVISPSIFFLNIFFLIFMLKNNDKISITKTLIKVILSFYAIAISIYILNFKFKAHNLSSLLIEAPTNLLNDTFMLYKNYFMIKDTHPNIGMLWSLKPETFLKFQNFTVIMLIIYQILFNILMHFLVSHVKNKKISLYFSLSMIINHIIDRYPTENYYIICIILLAQHVEVLKNQRITTLAVKNIFKFLVRLYIRWVYFNLL